MKLKYLLLIPLFLSILSCNHRVHYEKGTCVAVYYHERGSYSLMVEKDGKLEAIYLPCWWYVPISIFTDVAPNKDMWYEAQYEISKSYDRYKEALDFSIYPSDYVRDNQPKTSYIHIHIRSVKDIKGGGWNHGKFGCGQTHVLAN